MVFKYHLFFFNQLKLFKISHNSSVISKFSLKKSIYKCKKKKKKKKKKKIKQKDYQLRIIILMVVITIKVAS